MGKASLTIAISGDYNGKALQKAQEDLRKMQVSAAASMGGISGGFVRAGAALAELGGNITNAGKKMESVGKAATTGLTLPLVAAGAACGAAAVEIDTALTGVRKTVDGTEQQYQELKQAAIDFSKVNAVSASQILDIQALGAQLGFTIDELDNFSRVVSGLDIATNLDAETAATELAQFANITNMSHDSVGNFASALVGLGNTSATTEADIMNMAMRVAAAGNQVGMSQADILGLSAALASMGINAEAGGTAISTIMSQIDKDVALGIDSMNEYALNSGRTLEEVMRENSAAVDDIMGNVTTWADAAGMTATEFANAWKSDPVQALGALLSGMEKATDEGGNMAVMLDELGISSLRQTDVLKRLAGNSELVGKSVATANKEWQENTALQKEVDNRNESMSARFEILKNKVVAVAESVGTPLINALLEVVDAAEPVIQSVADAAEGFANMDEQDQRMILGLAAAAAAFGPVVTVLGKLTTGVGSFVTGVGRVLQTIGVATSGVKNMGNAAGQAAAGLKQSANESTKLGAAAASANTGASALTGGMKLLNGALKASAIGLVVGLVADLVGQFKAYAEHEKLVEDATTGLTSAMGAAKQAYEDFEAPVSEADKSLGAFNLTTDEVLQKQADLAKSLHDTWSDVGTNAASVDYYAGVIGELGNKGSLTADEQLRLKDAVEQFNEKTGASISILDTQTGKLSATREEIEKLVEAYKKQAEVEAAQESYSKVTEQLIQDKIALKNAQEQLNSAEEGWGIWIGDFPVIADEASVKYHDLQKNVSDLEAAVRSGEQAQGDYANVIAESMGSFETFSDALDSLGVNMSDFGNASEETLSKLESSFDGSLNSIVQACADNGVKIPQALANGIMVNSGLPSDQAQIMMDALVLNMTGGDVVLAAQVLGHDIDQGLKDGIEGNAEMPAAAIGVMSDDVIAKAKEAFQSNSPSQVMHQLGTDIDTGLANGIDGSADQPKSSMTSLSDALKNAISGLPGYSQETGSSSGANLSSGLSGQQGSVSSSATNLYNTAKSGIEPTKSAFNQTGRDSAHQFSSSIGSASAYNDGSHLAGTAKSGLQSVSAYGAGTSFVRGFGNGMQGVSLWSIAYNIGRSALGAIKSALGIASPSKETFGVGQNFVQGAINGMKSGESGLVSETDRLSGLMSLNPQLGTRRYLNPITSRQVQQPREVNFNITINVTARTEAEGVQVGKSIADTLFSEYQKRERGLAYASV